MRQRKTMSQSEYARHRGISPARISTLIKIGKIPAECYTMDKGRRIIDPQKADRALSENLDQISNPLHTRKRRHPDPDPALLELQDRAADYASEPEEGGGEIFWPLWACRYVGALAEISPGQVETRQISKTEFVTTIHDLNTETLDAAPWTMTLKFDFKK